ncbi:MAG: MBL fold metallo-hydrolase [Caldisericaceae bacterium]|nr:MBL fold metallo-hydrolase [Caldisericaceae bacterium]
MAIIHKMLGQPFQDNALYMRVESGQKTFRLLFDCGEMTISELSPSEVMKIDHLLFSHFHLDHVAGFDHFIRLNYNRSGKPVHIWGPEGTTKKVFNRLNSFCWNLLEKLETEWQIHELKGNTILHSVLRAKERFGKIRQLAREPFNGILVQTPELKLTTLILEHKIPVLGFKIEETDRQKVSAEKLEKMNLEAGPWLQQLLDFKTDDSQEIEINGYLYRIGNLRKDLLFTVKGDSLAYLTDFKIPEKNYQSLLDWLANTQILYCESQYLNEDLELAQKNYHLTVGQAAKLARMAEVEKLYLFHFSQRYKHRPVNHFIEEARKIFINSFVWDSQKSKH